MWTRYDLKMNAKTAFKRNYWTCVAVTLIVGFLTGTLFVGSGGGAQGSMEVQYNNPYSYDTYSAYSYGNTESVFPNGSIFAVLLSGMVLVIALFAVVYSIFVGNVVKVGGCRYYMENREHQTKASKVFYGFQNGNYWNVVKTLFFQGLFIFLWSLVLIVPGIIKSYSYLLVPYILSENPQMDRRRVLQLSEQMMKGHRMEAFVLELSFFGWILLSGLTCGVLGIFYVNPYMDATLAEFYVAIRTESIAKGLVVEGELPGYSVQNV